MALNKEAAARRLNQKKAQVGATITWIAAFLIIFFIMLLFLTASLAISKAKKVLSADYRISAEPIEEEPLAQSGMLVSLLNSRIEIGDAAKREVTVKEALEYLSFDDVMNWGIKAQIKDALAESIRLSKPQCYMLEISSGMKSIEFEDLASAAGLTFSYYLFSAKPPAREKAGSIYIQGKEGQVEIKLFAGRC